MDVIEIDAIHMNSLCYTVVIAYRHSPPKYANVSMHASTVAMAHRYSSLNITMRTPVVNPIRAHFRGAQLYISKRVVAVGDSFA